MREIIYSLPDQILETISLMPQFYPRTKVKGVLVCGMGGSGISGELLGAIYPEVQIISNKGYSVPEYVNKDILSILISYSGNTEETLNYYKILLRHKVPRVIISSDGKLFTKRCELKIKIPEGLPPRGALGYLFTPLPIILYKFKLIKNNPWKELVALAEFLKKKRDDVELKAKKLAKKFVKKLPIIYSNSPSFLPVANRWRCQLNENAKVLAHINIIPEMNHNEIVGLGRPEELNPHLLIVFLNDPEAYSRNNFRVSVIKELIKDQFGDILEITPEGKDNLQRVFWTIMFGDFISYYLAVETGVDPMPVKRIDYLKKRLAQYLNK